MLNFLKHLYYRFLTQDWDGRPEFLLQQLGSNTDEVAASLRKAGINGGRQMAGYCPISRYLYQQGYSDVRVTSMTIRCVRGKVWHEFIPPLAVDDFIHNFDTRYYPELDIHATEEDLRAGYRKAGIR